MSTQSNITTRTENEVLVFAADNGKVAKSTMKAASILAEASKTAIVSAAINGKGAVRKLAMYNLTNVQTVETFTSQPAIDGGAWSDFLTALTARYGVAQFNSVTMRGKSGAGAYMAAVVKALELKVTLAETEKAQETAIKKLGAAKDDAAHVTRLFTARLETPAA